MEYVLFDEYIVEGDSECRRCLEDEQTLGWDVFMNFPLSLFSHVLSGTANVTHLNRELYYIFFH